jgi:Protein of unknown function (DUF3305)
LNTTALLSFPVGVVVERHRATSPWLDFVWRPVSILTGVPAAAPWTLLAQDADTATFYAGSASIELYRTETTNYLLNLNSAAPLLWVVLRQREQEPPYQVLAVTADPAEGEAFTEAGNDLVETVPMPAAIVETVEAFVAEHHVERPFYKRHRDRPETGAPSRRRGGEEDQA